MLLLLLMLVLVCADVSVVVACCCCVIHIVVAVTDSTITDPAHGDVVGLRENDINNINRVFIVMITAQRVNIQQEIQTQRPTSFDKWLNSNVMLVTDDMLLSSMQPMLQQMLMDNWRI